MSHVIMDRTAGVKKFFHSWQVRRPSVFPESVITNVEALSLFVDLATPKFL